MIYQVIIKHTESITNFSLFIDYKQALKYVLDDIMYYKEVYDPCYGPYGGQGDEIYEEELSDDEDYNDYDEIKLKEKIDRIYDKYADKSNPYGCKQKLFEYCIDKYEIKNDELIFLERISSNKLMFYC